MGPRMILPKMSAALLSMSFFGSAYAANPQGNTSLEQWVVICGAANGAAAVFQAQPHDLALHRETTKTHINRFAAENGIGAPEFEPLFERGLAEGQRLVAGHSTVFKPRQTSLLEGFHHDKGITYADMQRVLSV